jgi:D-alanyl-D-alanine carboxypeptidase/D-alanyl-D-alanine-endopeptidase (penicillin-binding protein 4)
LILNIAAAHAGNNLLREKISGLLSKVPSSTGCGVLIYNPMTKDTLYQVNKLKSMIPASNTKLFTTAVALSELGGDFLINTKIFIDDKEIKDGVVRGNIYLKGYGNGMFDSGDLDKMVKELKKYGIKKINGSVIGDDSYFDEVYMRDDWIDDEVRSVNLPPVSALVYNRNSVASQVVKRRKKVVTVFNKMSNPPLQIAGIFRNKLIAEGISIAGGTASGKTPDKAKLLSTFSIPLKEFIKVVNKRSDNFLAECLFKILGAERCGCQGNAFYSTQAVLTFIADNGIYAKGTAIVDGSGISRYNQITPVALVGILEKLYFDIKNFDDFYRSLSVAGIDGTLRGRMYGSKAYNNMRGKTGTLNGVSSITGYVKNLKGEDIIVSIIFDFNRGGKFLYHDVQDSIISAVADSN